MQYDVKIKGEMTTVQPKNGYALKQMWEKFLRKEVEDQPIEIGSWMGRLADIKSIREVNDAPAKGNEVSDRVHQEYVADIQKLRNMTPNARAMNLGLFKLLYWGFTGSDVEQGSAIEKWAAGVQEKFFTEKPKRTLCDPFLFKPVLGKYASCDTAVMRVVETAVMQDSFAERHL